jgi:hypothetical protein
MQPKQKPMSQSDSSSILTLMYDFLKYLIPELAKFPRDQKFNTGNRIQNLTHDILDDIVTAYYTGFSDKKIERLREANVKLELLRFGIRLCHDLKLFSNEKYGVISGKINTIGGTLGNWIKKLEGRK